ncbi:amidase [Siminovitchia sediminis]|uniref:Amidase n=1 Tax=Siminovitchia sediminis TaxID=1274353 RepID=A0ABW4KGS1_9BACI
MTDLAYLPATELSPLIQTRQLSPVELTKHLLNRMEKIDPIINSYITKLNELALKQAKEAENSIMQGQYKGPLHGIPIGIKDNFETKGIRTTSGEKIFANYIPNKTATTVKKLLGSGGIMLGKLNMHQLGLGSTGINPTYGAVRNPWNTHYMTGGSSSGSAAALAAGMATLATGTDTWGSNRIPAAMCGVYGLKPTIGLVSTYGIVPTTLSMDDGGPFARSVSDLALMLNSMAGYDPKDPLSLNVPFKDYTANLGKGIRGLKIGIPTYYLEGLEPDIEKLFTHAISTLKALGAEVREIVMPELSLATFSGYATATGEGATIHQQWLQTHLQDYAADSRALLLSGSLLPTPKYLRAQQARRRLTKAFNEAFKDVDTILGPTTPITTPAFSKNWVSQNLEVVRNGLPFTVPANLTGIPSLCVPMGLDSKGLPAGMQLIGKHFSEQLLFQMGYAWESTNPLSYRTNHAEVFNS